MSWRGLLALGPVWTALCAGLARTWWVGVAIGGAFWLLIVVGRLWLEWPDADGWASRYRQ